ncbi:MAG: two-component system sensor histidine kinase EvgS [Candidatus Aldehydirespiratoraceae bacterium]|jgi:two-component system sensor histidine kinase EvgS
MNEEIDPAAQIGRLQRRLARSSESLEQAERIAEQGMRNLWDINQELKASVAERTFDAEQSLASATSASDAKERFLAELGHGLATPLHAILGLLELIDPVSLTIVDQGRVSEIRDHAVTLSGLLNGLVDLAGAEGSSAPQHFERRRPSAWLDQLIARWTREAAASGQLIAPSVAGHDVEIVLDWNRLTRIVDALMSNAVRHASAGLIMIEMNVVGDDARVTVTDAGPGMSPAELGTAFKPFMKHASAKGLGVGLSIAQRLAEGGLGSLKLESDEATTRAIVLLPLGRKAAEPGGSSR